jgi:acetyl-CoA C-acetyltransferase
VAEHWERTLEQLALQALEAAREDAGEPRVGALYVANALGPALAGQAQLGAHLAALAGLDGVEATVVEAAGASGGVALRQAFLAVASGAYDCVAVVGVEKVTDVLDSPLEAGLARGLESATESEQGLTLAGGWALLQQRYSWEHVFDAGSFAPFPVNAHLNGARNPNALYGFAINPAKVASAVPVATPIGLLDSSTVADGAAAVIIAAGEIAGDRPGSPIRIAASSVATAPLALATRQDPLWLEAAARSSGEALRQAGLSPDEVDVAEISDQHSIVAALLLEADGFVERGQAPRWAADGAIAGDGTLPIATFGGCKARGDAGGALGVYQIVELTAQLRAEAGANQVEGARIAFAQCVGGLAATVATHVLVKE